RSDQREADPDADPEPYPVKRAGAGEVVLGKGRARAQKQNDEGKPQQRPHVLVHRKTFSPEMGPNDHSCPTASPPRHAPLGNQCSGWRAAPRKRAVRNTKM